MGEENALQFNTVITYTYSLHRCGDGCTAHVNSLVKNRPVWPNIHRLMQFLRSATACGLKKRPGCKCCKNKNRSVARYRHKTASVYILFIFLPPLPDKRQNRKLSGSLLSTVNFSFFFFFHIYLFFLPRQFLSHRPPLPALSFQ